MKTISYTHVQTTDRVFYESTYEKRSIDDIIHELGLVAAYDPAAPYTVRMRNANNTITVVFGGNWSDYEEDDFGLLMQGDAYMDCIEDAVQFKRVLRELFTADSHERYTLVIPSNLPHVLSRYAR